MIRYTDAAGTIRAEQLQGFFVGWPKAASPEQHLAVLRGSHRAVMAVDDETDRVVGFVNMISDGVLTAYIPWLEVLPAYQDRGIGSELMRRILDGTGHLYSVDLLCEPSLQHYYERFGMRPVPGMSRLDRSALHG
ncbi:GNAT family N-acetyltransferase [Planomonospora venezuelensis]|uniref:Ribosomal protein S18 acetylase RimI-like enzyme n=1 Tax=Planomonospora venezuelensis TaxID=1999 RepID=A0A841CT06_PLAVE|nr:GNAT family N-acetyltransferase [Planomonospora venezuelensis]MBB5960941.1 ribosomal protein S18 acetylase RimI-like enzyme [Planomonospora venezuelensis]GIN01175.1 N-acetyltransferase [Planomonospora venezuelensis]